MSGLPSVGVVVVNHNGGDLTIRCLHTLLATDWPPSLLQVVLVDNASSDGLVDRVRRDLPDVVVIEAGANVGFGAGCNLGMRALENTDYVALINNDATVEPGWLSPLVAALDGDPGAGAAIPKILFDGAFVDVFLDSDTRRRGRGDNRALGVRVSGIRLDGESRWGSSQLVDGFWGVEHDPTGGSDFQWTNGRGHLRVPVRADGTPPVCELRLSADAQVRVTLRSGESSVEHLVGAKADWYDTPLDGEAFDVVNNVGSLLLADGHGADRGYLERDNSRYDEAEEVFAWCGAGVLLSRCYLDSVGSFEDGYFLYYEDLDLSWRGRAQGWRHVYVPASIVRHVHSASTVEGSSLFDHYVERNRLLTLTRNAPARLAWQAAARHVLITGSYLRRDVISPIARGATPSTETVRRRVKAFAAFAGMLPDALAQRRQIRGAQKVPDAELLRLVIKNPS